MTNLQTHSDELSQLVATAAASIVQVIGARRPASGVIHGPTTVLTTARAIGREDGLHVRLGTSGDDALRADLAGWDPATGLALLRIGSPLDVAPPIAAAGEPRPGAFALALARSWTNAVTASTGIVAATGGPLRTGRGRQIARVFRITAPVHDGFAGGGIFDASGRLAGIATGSAIRGFAVAIPASIAWTTAAQLDASGTPRRGFIGLAVQPVGLPPSQQAAGRTRALVILALTPSGPAASAGAMVGDLLVEFDRQPVDSPDALLERLAEASIGQDVGVRVLRGGTEHELRLTIGERPRR